jgi:hypothetical protein
MPTFEATTTIDAPAERVWDTLVRTPDWTGWDPALECVEGELAPDGRVVIRVRDQSRPFRLRVTAWEPGRLLVLAGGMPLGLFTGTRRYELDPAGAGTTMRMKETYSGPLAGMIGKSIPDLQPSFEAFVSGLRQAAESEES